MGHKKSMADNGCLWISFPLSSVSTYRGSILLAQSTDPDRKVVFLVAHTRLS